MNISLFRRWLDESDISLVEGLSIVQTQTGIAIVSIRDDPIIHPQNIASIPKPSILSVRSCALANRINWVPHGHGATLALSLALYSEMLRGTESKWHPYLQFLPGAIVPIARLWGNAQAFPDDADAHEASQWIRGTEIERELQDHDGTLLTDEIQAFYRADVQPLLDSEGAQPTLRGFLHAYSLVCSRAFLVDAYHGLSMVPVADAFNHEHENHVQLASEYDVCPVCGSLLECPHDRDDTSTHLFHNSFLPPSRPDPSDTVDMVTVRSIPPHTEVYNTYGKDLGNASLIARYGFSLEGGETDVVTFGWLGSGIVLDDGSDQEQFRAVYRQALSDLQPTIRTTSLLYVPEDDAQDAQLLSVNSDGQASLGLFLWAIWNALSERPPPELEGASDTDILSALPQFLPRAAKALKYVEAAQDEMGDAVEVDAADDLWLLRGAAEAIASLCRTRITGMGKKGYSRADAETIGQILDNLPPEKVKTKLALEYLLSERALLMACAESWGELEDVSLAALGMGSDVSDMEN